MAQDPANFADRDLVADAVDHDRHQVLGAGGCLLERREIRGDVAALLAQRRQFAPPAWLELRIDLLRLKRGRLFRSKRVDADDDFFFALDGFLMFVSRPVDRFIDVARLDGLEHAAEAVDLG